MTAMIGIKFHRLRLRVPLTFSKITDAIIAPVPASTPRKKPCTSGSAEYSNISGESKSTMMKGGRTEPAAAAKLRQLMPAMLRALEDGGEPVQSIRIKVMQASR